MISFSAWCGSVAADEGSVLLDFRQPAVAEKWTATHDVELSPTEAGLQLKLTGADPYLTGPLLKMPPAGRPIVLLRMQSDHGGGGQLFYFTKDTTEERSVRFSVPAGEMSNIVIPLPEVEPEIRLRLDPPGTSGICMVESLRIVSGLEAEWPTWERITRPTGEDMALLSSGALELRHSRSRYGVFEIFFDNHLMGTSGVVPKVAVEQEGQAVWLPLGNDRVELVGGHTVRATATAQLPTGGQLTLQQQFVRKLDGLIQVEATLSSTQDCGLVYAPLCLVFPGDGSFGDQKGQALFPGVEYLENEPSSSDADVNATRAVRRVPSAHKIRFPLMTVQAEGRSLGMIWEPVTGWQEFGSFPNFHAAALFDSPDRLFGTKSHVMGLIAPGSLDGRREDGQPLPRLSTGITPGQPLRLNAQLIAGRGETVIPAVQRYYARSPEKFESGRVPRATPLEMAELLTHGWLDTPLKVGAQFRHAVAGDPIGGQPAADAVWMMQQLASILDMDQNQESRNTAVRLRAAAKESLSVLSPDLLHHAAVGHIRSPNGTLLFGDPLAGMRQARDIAAGQLAQLGPDGKLEYVRHRDRPDFARTHWSKEANGLAAPVVARALEEAAFSGDQGLIDQAIAQLRKLDRYANTVPRGAQTWEIPLHTPDILASAHLVHAYALGYELTRDPKFLEQAKYWAWTGVPFVYLQPTVSHSEGQGGLFATIPVLGATHWDSVLWIGLPVQWCGLVYADALQRLSRYDDSGPWEELARGIALSGIQQTYPEHDPHGGLLPDSFNLLARSRNPADINPGTLQVPAVRALLGWDNYDVRKVVETGWTIHAPASITVTQSSPTDATFQIHAWAKDPYSILVHGLKRRPGCETRFLNPDDKASDEDIWVKPLEERYESSTGTLILKVQGQGTVRIDAQKETTP